MARFGPGGLLGFAKTRLRVLASGMRGKSGPARGAPDPAGANGSRGVFFIAFGEKYVDEAVHCARSIRDCSDLGIAILCDRLDEAQRQLFDHAALIKPAHIRAKVDFLDRTPFDNTLYLDSDTQVLEDLSEVFGILEKYDVAMAHDFARKRHRWCNVIPEYAAIPDGFSEFGGGVILYNRERAADFLGRWREYFYRYYRLTNGWDQASLRIAAWESAASIYVLPPEFNVRSTQTRAKTDTLPVNEGGAHPLRPRIYHWHGLNDPTSDVAPYQY